MRLMAEMYGSPEPTTLAHDAARTAGLRHVSDAHEGFTRRKRAGGFVYYYTDGRPIKDKGEIRRINRLAIPPAWTNVWICPDINGHIQATGRDARGRKQYRYHEDCRVVRDQAKFEHMAEFAKALPKIRRKVEADLRLKDLSREKALATVVSLLEKTLIRVGNNEYARENGSHGLTTLHNRHATVSGGKVTFHFKGKSGREHEISVTDPRLARVVRRRQELPGQELFAYRDADGVAHDITSDDVNAYIRQAAGGDFTAKDFRTWAGTVQTAIVLQRLGAFQSPRQARSNITAAIGLVARMLGNTPAICRKGYVHPGVLDHYLAGRTIVLKPMRSRSLDAALKQLPAEECAVLILLQPIVRKAAAG